VLGLVAVGALAYVAAATVALAVAAAGREVVVGVGPLVLVAVDRLPNEDSVTTLGPGLLVVAVVGGVVNGGVAAVLAHRSG
jgi:hypothetical protein